MSSIQFSKLVFGKSADEVKTQLNQIFADNDVSVDANMIPESRVGRPENFRYNYFCSASEQFFVIFGSMDYTQEMDNTQEIEFCGYNWLFINKATHVKIVGGYVNDYYHAFGKEFGVSAMRNHALQSGVNNFDDIWAKYIAACEEARPQFKLLDAA